jgi:2-polyprenyl-3-methyl-5-hydroxy-6-metoxy-1,4-benzoquinol methylase
MCSKDPYNIEHGRDRISTNHIIFKKLYSNIFPEIKDLNTPKFWDKRTGVFSLLKDQDGMTRDRVYTAYDFLNIKSGNVLDIGAGNGFLEELLSNNPKLNLFANDFSRDSIKNLRKRFYGTFKVESVYTMKYPKRFFDAVFVLEVLEHIPPSKIFNVLKKIRLFMKKGGILVVSVPTNEGLKGMKTNPNGHVRDYTPGIIKAELEVSGFKVNEITTLHAFKDLYSLKKLLIKFGVNKWKPNNIITAATLKV